MGRNATRWTAIIIVVLASLVMVLPTLGVNYTGFLQKILPSEIINLGLDLKGGTSLTYSVGEPEGVRWKDTKERDGAVDRCIEIIRSRVDAYGVSEADVHREVIEDQEAIVISLPGIKDPEQAKNWVGQTGQLEFRMVAGKDPREAAKILQGLLDLQETKLTQDRERIKPQFANPASLPAALMGLTTVAMTPVQPAPTMLDFFPQPLKSLAYPPDGPTLRFDPDKLDDVQASLAYIDNAHLERFWVRDTSRPEGFRRLYRLYFGNSDRKTRGKNAPPDILYIIDMTDRMFVSGRDIVRAAMEYGGASGASPHVSFGFNAEGGKRFGDVTSANINRSLAIILDDKVISAPNIKSAITEGSGIIEGQFSTEEAASLATTLRLGALPARLTLEQEAVVGSTLGADSIRNGVTASLAGLALAMFFLFLYYKGSGMIANSAIIINMLITGAILVTFRATLTLPGIAGYILSVGMSVDANVLIYERIREELRFGKTVRAAVDGGFKRAFITILDSNVTTMAGAVVLYIAGNWTSSLWTLKSFAITLIIGIAASFFTAIVFTRAVFEFLLSRRVTKLSI